MSQIPSAVDMAKELIKNNPDNFNDNFQTQLLIAKVMHHYFDKCWEYLKTDHRSIDFFEQAVNITKEHAKKNYGIDL